MDVELTAKSVLERKSPIKSPEESKGRLSSKVEKLADQ